MAVAVADQVGLAPDLLDQLERVALAAARAELGVEPNLSLVFCTDDEIADLNWTWLQHRGPTDVLSFPQWSPDGPTPTDDLELGDIVVSVETAARQGALYREWGTARELCLLVVHGVLHLCGHDDQQPALRAAMQAREDAILADLGLGPIPRDEE